MESWRELGREEEMVFVLGFYLVLVWRFFVFIIVSFWIQFTSLF